VHSTSRWATFPPAWPRSTPDAQLYVVCHAGGRSLRVAHYLARNGYTPINVSGGMLSWVGAGRPVVTDDGGVGGL